MFGAVLIANRGEIACRIARTLGRLRIRSVAVYSEVDAGAKHVRWADAAEPIGESPAPLSYMNPAAIVDAVLRSDAEAVHPGYGFLSESAKFAEALMGAGLAWIGPPPDVLELAGDKLACRHAFERSGFPALPAAGPFADPGEAAAAGAELGFPLMVKAVRGGGGIGMGVARDQTELRAAVDTASSRGARYFSDPAVFVERYVERARHLEVQVLFGPDGRGMHLYERECSVQRRHQKVIEETPSPGLDRHKLRVLCRAAVRSMEAIGYRGAGTVECILTPGGEFYFLEVNARLQVEHPVTEMTTGIDLVEEQLRIAAGHPPSVARTPPQNGHAVEFRIYAEDPRTFLPSPGRISRLAFGPGWESQQWRFDFGYEEGDEIPMFYDPLIGKVIFHSGNRQNSLATASCLEDLRIEGVRTNIPALLDVLRDERFRSGDYDTGLLGK